MIGIVAPVIALEEHLQVSGETISQICLHPGGQGVHVARVINEFGGQSTLASFIGGELAPVIRALLDQYRINHRLVTSNASNTAVLNLTADRRETTVYQLPAPKVNRHESDNLFEQASLLVLESEVVVIIGTLAEGMPRDFFARLVRLARRHGVRTVLDVAPEYLEGAVRAGPTVVKPGQHQLSQLLSLGPNPSVADLAQAADQLRGWGAETVVVSQAAEGAIVVGREGSWKVIPPSLEPVQQAGAGDCMVGVIAVGLSQGWPVEEIMKTAVAAGASKILRQGLGICKRDIAMVLREQVRMARICLPDRVSAECVGGQSSARVTP